MGEKPWLENWRDRTQQRQHLCRDSIPPHQSCTIRYVFIILLWSIVLGGIAVPLSVQAANQALDINSGELIIEDYELWNWRSSAFTIEWWWSPDSLSSSSFAVPIIQYADGAFECAFLAVDSRGGGYIGQYDQFGAGVVQTGRWQHFAFTYSGETGKFYKNGSLITTTPTDLFSQACRIGWNRRVKFVGGGKIDDVRIWNTARTQAQIQENRSRMLRGTTSGLECYLTFETDSFASGSWNHLLKDETGKQEVHFLSSDPAFAAGPSLSLPQNTVPVAQSSQFTISGYDYLTNTLRATDADGDSLIYQISRQPGKGTLRLTNSATGAFTYTPNQGVSGTDTFTFTAHDGVAPSAQATITITITPIPEPIAGAGQALAFDGQNDYVAMSGFDTWQPSQFTVEWWLNPRTHKSWNQKIESPNGWGRFVFHTTDNGSVYVGTDMGHRFTPTQLGAGTVTLNAWQHFAFTFDNGTGKFYKNGQLLASKTGMARPLSWGGFNLHTDGLVDNVRIWNVARSAEQIASAMKQNVAGDTSGLEASWTFDTDSGTLAADTTGRHDGTLHNMDPASARVASTAPAAAAAPVSFTFTPGSAHNSFSATLPGVTSRGERGMDVFCLSSSPDDIHVDTNMYSPEYQPCNPDGTFTFHHQEEGDQSSPDIVEFTYSICRMYKDSPDRPFAVDYSACSPEQAVYIKIDGSPRISGPLAVTLAEDKPYTGTLSGFDWDPAAIKVISNGSKGTVTLLDNTLTANNFAVGYTYTPNVNANGADSFRVSATDAAGRSSTATVAVTITPVNDAPVAAQDMYKYHDEDGESLIVGAPGVLSNDRDIENTPLTAVKISEPQHGALTLNPDGSFTYAPEPGYIGVDSFTYAAVDDAQTQSDATEVALVLRAFNIGDIPTFSVRAGQELCVPIYSRLLGTDAVLSHRVIGNAQGDLNLDAQSGLFTYTPGDNESIPFSVTFSAAANGKTVSQTVQMTPLPIPGDEAAVFGLQSSGASIPDDALVINEVPDKEEEFNTAKRKTRKISIAGKTVEFSDGSELYRRYKVVKDDDNDGVYENNIKELTIYAETVIIGSPWHLPQTNVMIYARKLRFEGDGQLITTPSNYAIATSAAYGKKGMNAGNITLYIQEFETESSQQTLFVMNGGQGEGATASKKSMRIYRCYPISSYAPDGLGRDIRTSYGRGRDILYDIYTGKAGDGGDGGTLSSTLNTVKQYQRAEVGIAGICNVPSDATVIQHADVDLLYNTSQYYNNKKTCKKTLQREVNNLLKIEKNAKQLVIDSITLSNSGNGGNFALLDASSPEELKVSWLSPSALNAVLTYVKDA